MLLSLIDHHYTWARTRLFLTRLPTNMDSELKSSHASKTSSILFRMRLRTWRVFALLRLSFVIRGVSIHMHVGVSLCLTAKRRPLHLISQPLSQPFRRLLVPAITATGPSINRAACQLRWENFSVLMGRIRESKSHFNNISKGPIITVDKIFGAKLHPKTLWRYCRQNILVSIVFLEL